MWRNTWEARDNALRNRHMKAHERLSEHTKRLPPLRIGDHVRVQNQTGPHPLKWDKTGTVVEVRQYDQYVVKLDGSNRTSLRNRKFLRKFLPAIDKPPPRSIVEDLIHQHIAPTPPRDTPVPPHADTPTTTLVPINQPISPPPAAHYSPDTEQQCDLPPATDPPSMKPQDPDTGNAQTPRRSGHLTRPPASLKEFVTTKTPSMRPLDPGSDSAQTPRRSGRPTKPPDFLRDFVTATMVNH